MPFSLRRLPAVLSILLCFCLLAASISARADDAVVDRGVEYANLRSAPSQDARVIARIANGSRLRVLDSDGEWVHVAFGPLEGYVHADMLEASGEAVLAPTAAPPSAPGNPYLFSIGDTPLTQQVGYGESLVDYQVHLSTSISYPVTGIPRMDEAISKWAKDIHAQLLSELEDLVYTNPAEDAESELTVHYSSYLTDRYVGVLEAGWYDSPFFARSLDILRAFNADLATGELIAGEDFFLPEHLPDVYALIEAKLDQIPESTLPARTVPVDASWLDNALLTDTGVAIALTRGDYLPEAMGMQLIELPYAQVEPYLRIPMPQQIVQPHLTPRPGTAQPGTRVIDPSRPVVALTFDDGPSEYTEGILELLTAYDGAATFCVVGNRVSNYEDQIRAIAAQGSEIATHTWSHKKLTTLSASEMERQIMQAVESVQKIVDVPVRFIRPPYGSVNDDVRAVARRLGMPIAEWSIDTEDWRTLSARKTEKAILDNVKNGSIVLMHDIHAPTAEAMKRVIPELSRRGYQLVTLSELFSLREGDAQAGVVYSHLDPKKIKTTP